MTKQEQQQERQERRARIRELCAGIAKMNDSQRQEMAERMHHNLITIEGRPLSCYNCCMIIAQGGLNCTVIGGYQQWKRAGRQVKKGEHSFAIWAPITPKKVSEEEKAHEDYNDDLQFILVSMFDISQTSEIGKEEIETESAQTAIAA